MQNQQKSWGDMMRLHAEAQKQREDFEHQLHKERQVRYKEELDNLLAERNNMKRMERNGDVEIRKKIEVDYETYKQQAIINRHALKDVQSIFGAENLRDHRIRMEQEKQAKQLEAMTHQERAQAYAELDRMQQLQGQQEKKVMFQKVQSELNDNLQWKQYSQGKQKEEDKQYVDEYARALANQESNRKKFFDNIRNRGQNAEVMEYYRQHYDSINQKQQDYEKNVIERAQFEKQKRDDEQARLKLSEHERRKQETLSTLQNQMMTKKELDQVTRQKELELENKHVQLAIDDHDRKAQMRKDHMEKAKGQHVEALSKQLEELRFRKQNEDMLTPIEERFNKNDVDFLDRKTDPSTLFTSPSFVPGRNLPFERKRQNHYINRALNINQPLGEAQRTKNGIFSEGGTFLPPQSDRDYSQQQGENPILQSVGRQTLSQQTPPERQPQPNNKSQNNLELQQPKYPVPNLPNARYTPQYQNGNQVAGFSNRNFDEKGLNQAATPDVNNRGRPMAQSEEYALVTRSQQDMKFNSNNDYLYLKGKHGPHANPVNIISNELKAPNTYQRNPYARF